MANNEYSDLLKDRIQRFKNTARLKNKDKIVSISQEVAWMVANSGESLNAAARDYQLRNKIIRNHLDTFVSDFYVDLWTRNPAKISDAIGGGCFHLNDNPFAVNVDDMDFMVAPEDYDLYKKDYLEFLWTKIIPRKFPNLLHENAIGRIKQAGKVMFEFFDWCNEINAIAINEYSTMGVLWSGMTPYISEPIEAFYTNFRGLKGLSTDIRRYPDKLLEVFDSIGVPEIKNAQHGTDMLRPLDYVHPGAHHTTLSGKQYEKFIYPYLKQIFNFADEYDKVILCFWEGLNTYYYDYLLEAPAGHMIYYFEKDNMFEAKKVFQNKAALYGGMPTALLGKGTEKECVEYARKLVNELGCDGQYFFGADIMLSYPQDCKKENLLAVNEYINSL